MPSALRVTRLLFCHVAAWRPNARFSARSLLFSSANLVDDSNHFWLSWSALFFNAPTLRRSAVICFKAALAAADGLLDGLVLVDRRGDEIVVLVDGAG